MIRQSSAAVHGLAHLALCLLASLTLVACGSGAVSGSAATSGPITISPSSATVYSDLPTTFVISGGNGSYIVTSSNQAALPVVATTNANSFTVVPNVVAADTSVTLTVSDTAATAPATAAVVVKPRTISNVVTVTPSSSQSAACGTAICSGGDAELKITLTQAGVPLVGRLVRFDVVSGDVRVITSPAGVPETLSVSGTTTTDGTGTARMRIRVLADANAQTAILQISDLASGFSQSTSVTIAPASNAALTVQPTSIQFTGPDSNTCASGIRADVIVIGGRPPYQVTQPPGFLVSPLILGSSGGRVTVTSTGQCAQTGSFSTPERGQTMSVLDSNGASVTVSIHNDTAPVSAVVVSPFVVAPIAVTLDSCTAVANIALVGGSGRYFGASGSSAVSVAVNGSLGIINRAAGTTSSTSPISVAFSDGQEVKTVTVTLTAPATCP